MKCNLKEICCVLKMHRSTVVGTEVCFCDLLCSVSVNLLKF
jgi:hypothetical protein